MRLKSIAVNGLPADGVVCWVFFTTKSSGDDAMLAAHTDIGWSSRQDGHEGGGVYGEVTHYYEMPTCLSDIEQEQHHG